jgi:hypothetical protein
VICKIRWRLKGLGDCLLGKSERPVTNGLLREFYTMLNPNESSEHDKDSQSSHAGLDMDALERSLHNTPDVNRDSAFPPAPEVKAEAWPSEANGWVKGRGRDLLPPGWRHEGDEYIKPDGSRVNAKAHYAHKSLHGVRDPVKEMTMGNMPSVEERAQDDEKAFDLESVKAKETKKEQCAHIRATEPNLVKRAVAVKQHGGIKFKVFETKNGVPKAYSCDQNRWAILDGLFGEAGPHLDLFRGRIVDDKGVVIDDRYPIRDFVESMQAAQLEGQSAASVRTALAEWALARRRDDLILKINARLEEHPWDGESRIEGSLIKIFQCDDTPTNKQMGIYFWLSLAARMFYPGRLAPITLSLFGAQNVGKSYFSKIICEEIMHNKTSSPVDLNLSSKNEENFLREITGAAPVANIGEMQGFKTADINWVKAFIARTSDYMSYKYEGHFEQQRRWITIMDGNKYEGLQRDNTGNRRFYPMFVMQLKPDEDGNPNWKGKDDISSAEKLDLAQFRSDFWLYMSEAKAWLDSHSEYEYTSMVNKTSQMVQDFNAIHIRENIGTPRDPVMETFFPKALEIVDIKFRATGKGKVKGKGDVDLPAGVTIYIDDTVEAMSKLAPHARVSFDSVKNELVALASKYKGTEARMNNGRRGFLYVPPVGTPNEVEWLRHTLQSGRYDEF